MKEIKLQREGTRNDAKQQKHKNRTEPKRTKLQSQNA